ncbi:class I SAM-dependent methyltransferase [Kineosporia sp. J2-2]|uniref:Class I SAM-dependent methyltransferase n=1 Tax=Kineosporia corallincola TaxID=2835133 RepID=A0ABS5TRJ5_9ACTN|nr:class I SAM-dependent methyltransferase [Kineosporia corallincola]MBT0773416.1 class I SAM-dependent methyltransferase [Kineosporia corallincola]
MNTLSAPRTVAVLDRLYAAAAESARRGPTPTAKPIPEMNAAEKADALEQAYMPLSPEGGRLLYALTRSARPTTVVEFGMSYGISTLHLAAAVADNGIGQVYTTELSATKVAAARATFAEAGLDQHVTVLAGDALDTLATVDGPIGLVLLDGWKDLYVPVLRKIENRLAPGALVVADNTDFESVGDYLAHVRDPANGYVSIALPIAEGMEVSCRA